MNSADQLSALQASTAPARAPAPAPATPQDRLDEVYELERCVDWVQQRGLTRVALQFPDCLLQVNQIPCARLFVLFSCNHVTYLVTRHVPLVQNSAIVFSLLDLTSLCVYSA